MISFKSLKRFLRVLLFSIRKKQVIPITTKVGKNVKIKAKSVTIANHVTIGKNVHISCNTIHIGRGVFIDDNVKNRKTYYYKLEDINLNGTSTMHGTVSATPRLIYGLGK